MLQATLHKKNFHFNFEARTSRGVMKERTSWFIRMFDGSSPEMYGIGECAPLAGLSPELTDTFEERLKEFIEAFNHADIKSPPGNLDAIRQLIETRFSFIIPMSSVVFGFETAMLDLFNGGDRLIFRSSFVEGKPIPINGLIWMGGMDFMLQQIEIKIRDGFRCIKLKVGGLDFEKECDVLQYVRRKYFRENITVRLDANGAFKPEDVLYKLNELSKFNIHSIEQPLKKGSELLPEICASSPIPVALDEELLGITTETGRQELLTRVKPRFIILKPALHGGLSGSAAWIDTAGRNKIDWWMTSALESNVGLNAIAQFTGQYPIEIHQGLGTGAIYDDNFQSPLQVLKTGNLGLNPKEEWIVDLNN
ncbi:MAG TPA: o-succinylbenzoate synthase [Cyclobacteriaceae bacterium]|nr:o-succinylbenzoate synthase [Cyclobacteriaceae bacterium]